MEYKSPEDHLDIDTFYKILAYACLYKSYGKTVDAIKAEDITISIIREAKLVELFRYFRGHGCNVTEVYGGIMKKGIQDTVDSLRDFGHKDAEIKTAIIKRYNLYLEEAEDYLRSV